MRSSRAVPRKDKLVDSHGYAYGQRKSRSKSSYTVLWECTTRWKGMRCDASVKQIGDHFTRGPREHCHPPEKGNSLRTKISMAAKKAALEDLFKPAATITQSLLTDHRDDDFLPKPENLIRTTNLHKQRKRPKDPVDHDFTVSDYVPEVFFQKDDQTEGR